MEERTMGFKQWLKQYKDADCPIGYLARDAMDDKTFPHDLGKNMKTRHDRIRYYLESVNACDDCLDTFEEAWMEYERCLKRK
jgi:uncharacterized protein YozE (UPF0346 family)